MKRSFFRFLLKLIPDRDGFWYRVSEKVSRLQANCPKCKSWETAIANDKCSNCLMNEVLEYYREEMG